MRAIALLLVGLGVVALTFGGISHNRQGTAYHSGGIRATATGHRTTPVAPIFGVLALVGGIALLATRSAVLGQGSLAFVRAGHQQPAEQGVQSPDGRRTP